MLGRFVVPARTGGNEGELIAAHAARQHGLVRSAQLLAAGLDSSAVAKRVRAGRLALEVDGPGHTRPRTRAEDERRDATLHAAGYEVLRFDEPRPRAATEAVAARAAVLPTARWSRA